MNKEIVLWIALTIISFLSLTIYIMAIRKKKTDRRDHFYNGRDVDPEDPDWDPAWDEEEEEKYPLDDEFFPYEDEVIEFVKMKICANGFEGSFEDLKKYEDKIVEWIRDID